MQPVYSQSQSTDVLESASLRPPICVDLDGTLVCTDTLLESLLIAFKAGPRRFLAMVLLLFRNRSVGKKAIAEFYRPNPATLPYHAGFLDFLRRERSTGRRLLLVTGADQRVAQEVSEHLGIFDEVLASDGTTNLTGARKAAAIGVHLRGGPFVYAGNSYEDRPVWGAASAAVLVNVPAGLANQVKQKKQSVEQVFPPQQAGWRAWIRLIRVKQWVKNLLIVVPLFLAHRFNDISLWIPTLTAMLAFSTCASALYVWNDLSDIQADRAHPHKRRRPLASAEIGIPAAFVAIGILLATAGLLAWSLPSAFQILLAIYAVGSLTYTVFFKQVVFLDVITLATLYTLRIFCGGAATGIEISMWTIVFSIFVFLSLALLKRLAELKTTRNSDSGSGVSKKLPGRGYVPEDLPMLTSLASAAAYVSVLVVGLYIYSPEVQLLYSKPEFLWLILPVVIYWLSRTLLLANRGEITDDPVVYALRDPASYGAGIACVIVVLLAA